MTSPEPTRCCNAPAAGAEPRATGAPAPTDEAVRAHVRQRYATAAACCDRQSGASSACGYSAAEMAAVPAGADLGLGCGNPTALGAIAAGETVLDLGSGAGIDCFLAARAVGPRGRVIGIDMTPQMVSRARRAAGGRFPNVEFRRGEIEHLPIPDAAMDVVISNCVLNLVPDKAAAFAEIRRVLKPGGRAYVSDIVLLAPLPAAMRADLDTIASCVGGAMLADEYRRTIEDAGLAIERFDLRAVGAPAAAGDVVRSADIVLRKPR